MGRGSGSGPRHRQMWTPDKLQAQPREVHDMFRFAVQIEIAFAPVVGGGALSKVRARLVQATAQPCQRDMHRLTMPIRSLSGQKTQCRHQLLRQRGRPLVHRADDAGADARQPVHE
eukprot:scaffold1495_cov130-Isochrysis_galbana.AAC.1